MCGGCLGIPPLQDRTRDGGAKTIPLWQSTVGAPRYLLPRLVTKFIFNNRVGYAMCVCLGDRQPRYTV